LPTPFRQSCLCRRAFRRSGDFVEHLRDLASEAPVIRWSMRMIGRVIELRASDIHLEPFDDGLHLRYRVDGALRYRRGDAAPQQGAAVSSRIKLLAHLDIAERRLPQDGRIRPASRGRELDLRVSTVPSVHGESVVMRVLDRTSVRLSLEDMRIEKIPWRALPTSLRVRTASCSSPGPPAAGKTTTLYAGLSRLDAGTQKIVTVEDPVEYQLRRHRADPGARADRPELCQRAALHPAPGPGRGHDRRDARRRDGADRRAVSADRPPGAVDAAHQRPPPVPSSACSRHGRGALPHHVHRQRRASRSGWCARCASTARRP
jgi:hypothetical protein